MSTLSVLTTVYNREEAVLRRTFSALYANDLEGVDVVVVDDGSTLDYSALKDEFPSFRWVRVDTVADRPGTYNLDGHNNPAYAWNSALDAARGDLIFTLSSDCLLPQNAIERARGCGSAVWHGLVDDKMTAMEFLGPSRIAPYGWATCWDRRHVDVRWDEGFLRGLCWEDNDISAQLARVSGKFLLDGDVQVIHQSHEPTAYSDNRVGFRTNQCYIASKWGGLPWQTLERDPVRYEKRFEGRYLVLDLEVSAPQVVVEA